MNGDDQNQPTDEQQRFDLLVDGELDEPRRRELLLRLDDEPGGWRRCALAFLEAQSWRQGLGTIVSGSATAPRSRRPGPSLGPGRSLGTLMAMAASFLVALLLAWQLQGVWWSERPAAGPSIGDLADAQPPQRPPESPAEDPLSPPAERPAASSGRAMLVDLPGPEGDGQPVPLLVVEGQQFGKRWLEGLPAPISPETLESLRQAGMQVEQRREWLTLPAEDGRQLVVPVDQVDVHYVGNPTL